MVAQTPLDGNPASLTRQTTMDIAPPPPEEFDKHAKNGWEFFTKFLFWNVIVIVAGLLFVGLLTVWR